MIGVMAAIAVAGGLATRWSVSSREDWMREDLIEAACSAEHGLNVERVGMLRGVAADTASHAYKRTKEQLAALRFGDENCRFVYVLAKGPDGRTKFLVDNEPADSKDVSPPGQDYDEAPEAVEKVFKSGAPGVAGPYTDRWGEWVVGLAPILDRRTGSVVAVLGMDFRADAWERGRIQAAIPPVAATVALLLVAVAASLAGSRRATLAGEDSRWGRHLETVVAILVGGVVTVAVVWEYDLRDKRMRKIAFAQIANEQADAVGEKLRKLRDTELESMARYFLASQKVSQ